MGNVWDIKARYKAAMNNEIRSDRGFFGGSHDGSNALSWIDYIQISSTGNSANFGDTSVTRYCSGTASATRSVWMG